MKVERILYLSADRGIPIGGTKGSSVHIRQFVAALKEASYRPLLVATSGEPNAAEELGVPVFLLDPPSGGENGRRERPRESDRDRTREEADFRANEAMEKKLEELYDRERFHLVYERYSLFGLAGLRFARRHGIPHVLEVNAPLVPEASRYRRLANRSLAAAVEGFLFCMTDHVVAVSEAVKSYVCAVAPATPVTIVPNGVDLARFGETGTAVETDASTADSKRDFVVGFVGSVRPWHGVDLLVDAVGELAREHPRVRLQIVGQADALRPELETRARERGIADRTTFTGPVPFDEIPAMIKGMDAVAAPYPALEGFYFSPLKIFEYMAAGRPIVASAIGQLTEILRHEKTALLVPPGDPGALKDALLRLVRDRDLGRRLGLAAAAEARSRHGWNRRMADIGAIFAGLTRDTGRGVSHAR
jgi:glycosyltransferase involved in cell wall biosynthesis